MACAPADARTRFGRNPDLLVKTKMCSFFMLGQCTRGDVCRYAHNAEELQRVPDVFRTKFCPTLAESGSCNDERCRFAHSKVQRPPRRRAQKDRSSNKQTAAMHSLSTDRPMTQLVLDNLKASQRAHRWWEVTDEEDELNESMDGQCNRSTSAGSGITGEDFIEASTIMSRSITEDAEENTEDDQQRDGMLAPFLQESKPSVNDAATERYSQLLGGVSCRVRNSFLHCDVISEVGLRRVQSAPALNLVCS